MSEHNTAPKEAWQAHRGETHRKIADMLVRAAVAFDDGCQNVSSNVLQQAQEQDAPTLYPYSEALMSVPHKLFNAQGVYDVPKSELALRWQLFRAAHGLRQSRHVYLDGGRQLSLEYLAAYKGVRIALLPEIFASAEQSVAIQQRNGRCVTDAINSFRRVSVKALDAPEMLLIVQSEAVDSYDSHLASLFPRLSQGVFTPAEFSVFPVGEYGEVFARNLAATYALGYFATTETLQKWAKEEGRTQPRALLNHLARYRIVGPQLKVETALKQTIREGQMSNLQALSLLTAKRVEGYDTPEALWDDIIRERLVQKFIAAVPMGFLAPMVFSGRRFTKPLVATEQGLRLDPALMTLLQTARDMQREQSAQAIQEEFTRLAHSQKVDAREYLALLGLICPAAVTHGAHQRLFATQRTLYDSAVMQ